MSMIEQLGEQMMEPMRHAMGDALAVAEEQARRYKYALAALNGEYPGSPGVVNGHANGHANGYAALTAASAVALAEAEPEETDSDPHRVDPRKVSTKDAVEAALRSAANKGFIGVTDIPGAMKAFEVVEVLDAWGWRDRSATRVQTIMSTLSQMAKDGKAVRVDRGSYVHPGLFGDGSVVLDEEGQRVDPNAVSIKTLVRHVIRSAGGEALRPIQVVARMEAAGWTNRNGNRASTVRSLLARLMQEGVVVRPSEGVYAWNVDGHTPVPSAEPAAPPAAPKKVSRLQQRDPNVPTGAELAVAVLQGSPGQAMVAQDVMAAMVQTGWTTTSARPLGVVQACLAELVHKNPNVQRPELGQYVFMP